MRNENKELLIHEARRRTDTALVHLKQIDDLLVGAFSIDQPSNLESLKRKADFPEAYPVAPQRAEFRRDPPEPDRKSYDSPWLLRLLSLGMLGWMDNFSYTSGLQNWRKQCAFNQQYNQLVEKEYNENLRKWELNLSSWESRRSIFLAERDAFNATVDRLKIPYFAHNDAAIVEYCELILNCSTYPETFERGFDLEYKSDSKILIVEYQLPSIDSFPTVKEVKYIATREEFKEYRLSEVQLSKIFDDAMYKITLRTIQELFQADMIDALRAISFNGWVRAVNKATGRHATNCILSIQVTKSEFSDIELERIDPKSCFKSLKGVASSKLSGLTSVRPILQINKEDKRFVDSYRVADSIDGSTNIAAMDWEDFEHLIRELFEKEFSTNGGEVKVTRASRDGGVDAIAFDPDTLRGGKIVIQAKRYTNTVGVSAVRDLYGTVVNEGATKGILVTTADYGPDAYEFARGKPITLLSGSNLLHLLKKHGHHAKIDITEAKAFFAVKNNRDA